MGQLSGDSTTTEKHTDAVLVSSGSVLVLLLLFIVCACFYKRGRSREKRKPKKKANDNSEESQPLTCSGIERQKHKKDGANIAFTDAPFEGQERIRREELDIGSEIAIYSQTHSKW